MKLIHTSDLHLGKKTLNQDRSEEQWDLLEQMLTYAKENGVEGIIIAGDIFDTSNPGFEALNTLDELFTRAARDNIALYVIAGNHDSSMRLRFGARLFKENNLHIVTEFDKEVTFIDLDNKDGKPVRLHMLPFIRPINVALSLETKVNDHEDMFDKAMETAKMLEDGINILVAHQNFRGAKRSQGEFEIGGIDQISTSRLSDFDYCALGHIHKKQRVGTNGYYPGSILKYNSDEAEQTKCFHVLDIRDDVSVESVELHPKRDIQKLEETFETLMDRDFYKEFNLNNFYKIVLQDSETVYRAFHQLISVYPNLLELTYQSEEKPTKKNEDENTEDEKETISLDKPSEVVGSFYEFLRGKEMTAEQQSLVSRIWEETNASD